MLFTEVCSMHGMVTSASVSKFIVPQKVGPWEYLEALEMLLPGIQLQSCTLASLNRISVM